MTDKEMLGQIARWLEAGEDAVTRYLQDHPTIPADDRESILDSLADLDTVIERILALGIILDLDASGELFKQIEKATDTLKATLDKLDAAQKSILRAIAMGTALTGLAKGIAAKDVSAIKKAVGAITDAAKP